MLPANLRRGYIEYCSPPGGATFCVLHSTWGDTEARQGCQKMGNETKILELKIGCNFCLNALQLFVLLFLCFMIIKNFVKTNLEIAAPVVGQVPSPPPTMVKRPIKKKCGKAVASNGFWVSETKVDLLVTFFLFPTIHPFLRMLFPHCLHLL